MSSGSFWAADKEIKSSLGSTELDTLGSTESTLPGKRLF